MVFESVCVASLRSLVCTAGMSRSGDFLGGPLGVTLAVPVCTPRGLQWSGSTRLGSQWTSCNRDFDINEVLSFCAPLEQ